jgi:RNA polymerase sigma-70 factor, ECF subfamily
MVTCPNSPMPGYDPPDIWTTVERAAAGDEAAWRALVDRYADRLRRMIAVRADPRLAARVDPADLLQDALTDAFVQLPEYVRDPRLPVFMWLRMVTGGRLNKAHRHHLGTQQRDVRREVRLDDGIPQASSAALVRSLFASGESPGHSAARREEAERVRDVLDRLDPIDREALVLRHFEQLSAAEAAQVLGIRPAAMARRYFRALQALRTALGGPGRPVGGAR